MSTVAHAGSLPVFQVCAVLFVVGVLALLVSNRFLAAPKSTRRDVGYWTFGVVGVAGVVFGGLFGLISGLVLLSGV